MARKRLVEAVWERTTRLLRDGAGRLAPVALAAIFLPQWLSGIATAMSAEGGVAGSLWGVLGLALTLVTFWAQLVLTGYAVDGDRSAAVRRATTRFLPVAGISLLLLVGLAVLALPVAGILAGSGVDLTGQAGRTSPGPAAVAWIGLYLLVLAPLLLWLFARLLPLSAVALFERRGVGAFPRAFALTRGAGAALFGTLLLYMVVVVVTVPAVRSVSGVVFTLLFGNEGSVPVASVLTAGMVALATTGFAVLQAVFTGTLYAVLAAPPAGLAADPTHVDEGAGR